MSNVAVEHGSLFFIALANARAVSSSTIVPAPAAELRGYIAVSSSASITGFPIQELLRGVVAEDDDPIAAERLALVRAMRDRQLAALAAEDIATSH